MHFCNLKVNASHDFILFCTTRKPSPRSRDWCNKNFWQHLIPPRPLCRAPCVPCCGHRSHPAAAARPSTSLHSTHAAARDTRPAHRRAVVPLRRPAVALPAMQPDVGVNKFWQQQRTCGKRSSRQSHGHTANRHADGAPASQQTKEAASGRSPSAIRLNRYLAQCSAQAVDGGGQLTTCECISNDDAQE